MTMLQTLGALRLRDAWAAAVVLLCMAAAYIAPETLLALKGAWPW